MLLWHILIFTRQTTGAHAVHLQEPFPRLLLVCSICIYTLQGMQRRGSALPSFSTDVPMAPPPGPELPEMGVFAPQATSNGTHRMPLTDDTESLAPQSARCV